MRVDARALTLALTLALALALALALTLALAVALPLRVTLPYGGARANAMWGGVDVANDNRHASKRLRLA